MAIRIYTGTGDSGHTGLFGGRRVPKDDLRVSAIGAVDELNAALGLAALHVERGLDDLLNDLQHELFLLGADLATPTPKDTHRGSIAIQRMTGDQVRRLETLIDQHEDELPPLTQFILPGGTALSAALHWARVVCRRAERHCVTLARDVPTSRDPSTEEINERTEAEMNPEVIRYLNRLSDLLFVLARVANYRHGIPDVIWRGASSHHSEERPL